MGQDLSKNDIIVFLHTTDDEPTPFKLDEATKSTFTLLPGFHASGLHPIFAANPAGHLAKLKTFTSAQSGPDWIMFIDLGFALSPEYFRALQWSRDAGLPLIVEGRGLNGFACNPRSLRADMGAADEEMFIKSIIRKVDAPFGSIH